MKLTEPTGLRDVLQRAESLAAALAVTAVQRDLDAGLPETEIQGLRDAGLLDLIVPEAQGGQGAGWPLAFQVTQALSRSEGSLGQLYANHLGLQIAPALSGTTEQRESFERQTAEHHWFWANALVTRDRGLFLRPEGEHFRLDGMKRFGTGVAVADVTLVSAVMDGRPDPVTLVLPAGRAGLSFGADWNNMGQRRTASGSVHFDGVPVYRHELLLEPHTGLAFRTFSALVSQTTKSFVYLGLAQGALEHAKSYLQTQARAWNSGHNRATDDPYTLRRYGELWMEWRGAQALANEVAQSVQKAWEQGWNLTEQERGEVAVQAAAAKTLTGRVGLSVTSGLFEVMGARATASGHGFDRYWRDMRTFTLHDPADQKLKEIGALLLNGQLPEAGQYS